VNTLAALNAILRGVRRGSRVRFRISRILPKRKKPTKLNVSVTAR